MIDLAAEFGGTSTDVAAAYPGETTHLHGARALEQRP
jgi:hypothetical protein